MRVTPRWFVWLAAICSLLLFAKVFFSGPLSTSDSIRRAELYTRARGSGGSANNADSVQMDGSEESRACVYDPECESPALTLRASPESARRPPFLCLNDISIFTDKDLTKGLNVALYNEGSGVVEQRLTFDVSTTDEKLIAWLKSISTHHVLFAVSFGDMAEHISADSRSALALFGASKIKEWRGGSAYLLVGQWGLAEGGAEERISPLSPSPSSLPVFSQCQLFPLGKLTNVSHIADELHRDLNRVDESKLAELVPSAGGGRSSVLLGVEWAHCGMDKHCDGDMIPMHLYSGANKDDTPKMCVDGRFVFDRGLNDAGRGLNVAVMDPKSRAITRAAHFDTYENDSTALESFLDTLSDGELFIAVSFDEASTQLSEMARHILYELGSSMAERIKFRSSWYMVGQKGIAGFTPFEDLNFATGNNWARAIKQWICVPTHLGGDSRGEKGKGTHGSRDSHTAVSDEGVNVARRHYCTKYDGHNEFCEESHLDDAIVPRPLSDPSLAASPIYNVPIVVVAGLQPDGLRQTLESLIAQEGINTQLVLVAYNTEYKQAADLSSLFHVKALPLNATATHNEQVLLALRAAFHLFPRASEIIVIEEEVILSPSALPLFSSLLPVLRADSELATVQAFNYNGFVHTSGREEVVYRLQQHPPAFAYMLKRSYYENTIRGGERGGCCGRLHRWRVSNCSSLVPDVSRVRLLPSEALELADDEMRKVHARERTAHSGGRVSVSTAFLSPSASYDELLKGLIKRGTRVEMARLGACMSGEKTADEVLTGINGTLVVVYEESISALSGLSHCFQLFFDRDFVTAIYKRVIRFTFSGGEALLVSNKSPLLM